MRHRYLLSESFICSTLICTVQSPICWLALALAFKDLVPELDPDSEPTLSEDSLW
jgi:hypothetical protein